MAHRWPRVDGLASMAWRCRQTPSTRPRESLGRTRAAVSYMILSLEKDLEADPDLRQLVEELL